MGGISAGFPPPLHTRLPSVLRQLDPADDVCGMVFGDHPYDDPAQPLQYLVPANVFEVLASVGAVLVAVVLHG